MRREDRPTSTPNTSCHTSKDTIKRDLFCYRQKTRLEEHPGDHGRDPVVAPKAVHQQQGVQHIESPDRVVGTVHSGSTFDSLLRRPNTREIKIKRKEDIKNKKRSKKQKAKRETLK